MKKGLAFVGVVLLFLGAISLTHVHTNPLAPGGNSGCPSADNLTLRFFKAGISEIQNGGSVDSYVLALRVPLNGSRITVVNNPDGDRYTFTRQGALYYPPKPLHFRNIYVENVSWRKNIGVYTASRNYAGFLNATDGRLSVSRPIPNFGGLSFICARGGFLLNVSSPRGVLYGDETYRLMSFSNESFTIGNKTEYGTPLSLLLVCDPCSGYRLSYRVIANASFGGFEMYSGVFDSWLQVVLPVGFNFTEMTIYPNYTAYRAFHEWGTVGSPCTGEGYAGMEFISLILLLTGAFLLGVSAGK